MPEPESKIRVKLSVNIGVCYIRLRIECEGLHFDSSIQRTNTETLSAKADGGAEH